MSDKKKSTEELERARTALLVCTVERALLMDLSMRVCKTEAWSAAHEIAVEELEAALNTLAEDKPDLPRWSHLIDGVAHVLGNHRYLDRLREIGKQGIGRPLLEVLPEPEE